MSQMNLSSLTNMQGVFSSCKKLTDVDLSNIVTPKITDLSNLFNQCESLTSVNFKEWILKL